MSRHLHPHHGQKAQPGGALHLGSIDGMNGTLMDGKTKKGRSVTTSTTLESRTDQHKETCAETSGRCLICCQVHLNPDSTRSLAHFSKKTGSFAFRQ